MMRYKQPTNCRLLKHAIDAQQINYSDNNEIIIIANHWKCKWVTQLFHDKYNRSIVTKQFLWHDHLFSWQYYIDTITSIFWEENFSHHPRWDLNGCSGVYWISFGLCRQCFLNELKTVYFLHVRDAPGFMLCQTMLSLPACHCWLQSMARYSLIPRERVFNWLPVE